MSVMNWNCTAADVLTDEMTSLRAVTRCDDTNNIMLSNLVYRTKKVENKISYIPPFVVVTTLSTDLGQLIERRRVDVLVVVC